MPVKLTEDNFGCFIDDDKGKKNVSKFTFDNGNMSFQVINYGASISSLNIPDSRKRIDDIVMGYNNIDSYVNDNYYFGSTIGRFANRIAKGKFHLQDKEYSLSINNGPNHLHGGIKGFNKVLWSYISHSDKVVFYYTSSSMEENYPGELSCSVTYQLTESNEIIIEYYATATESTPVNLTNHSYFNLGGHGCGTVHDHLISINADCYIPVDDNSIPTGDILPVYNTRFDLRKPQAISSILDKGLEGVDHNFCLNTNGSSEKKVGRIEHPKSGRIMEIFTTQPGVQFYTANFLPTGDLLLGKDRQYYRRHGAFCLETQNYPDAINHINFPKAYIDAGEEYKHTTRLCFSVK